MQFRFQLPSSSSKPSRILNAVVLISFSVGILYLILSIYLVRTRDSPDKIPNVLRWSSSSPPEPSLDHIVFGIASSAKSWPKRRDMVRLWWTPQTRGCVFLDRADPNAAGSGGGRVSDPPVCVSGDTSRFRYTYRKGLPSAIRVARVVSETVALNHRGVRWFVFGDDDTVFFPENLAKTLWKYDHRLWYYVGSNSEVVTQNQFFSYQMAFGGAGFAISYPLAKVLARVFDSCLERYPHLYGSDGRVYSCLAELGVGLTHEPGFHQMDFRGDIFGYLAAHPLTPLVSLHHLDYVEPIFPNKTAIEAVDHLLKAVRLDPHRILQQTVCYDRWFSWTVSVSWGYAVQVFRSHIFLPDVLPVQQTFQQWRRGNRLAESYTFDAKKPHPDPCRRQIVFLLERVSAGVDGHIRSSYRRLNYPSNCSADINLEEVRVVSKKLELDIKQLQAPRRQCCDVLPSSVGKVLEIGIRECGREELIRMYP